MKKFLVVCISITIFAALFGFIRKNSYSGCGYDKIETVDDAFEQTASIDMTYGDNASNGFVLPWGMEIFDIEKAEAETDCICVIKPYNDYHQYGEMYMQKVKITKVIKGNSKLENSDIYYAVYPGLYLNNGIPSFNGDINILDYNYEYLSFLSASELNYLTKIQVYRNYVGQGLYTFRISGEQSQKLYKDGMTFSDMKECEYFCNTKEALDELYSFKKTALSRYELGEME